MMGGFELNTLKKLKGLRLTFPSLSIVLAKHIGLGATAESNMLCSLGWEIVEGSMVLMLFIIYRNLFFLRILVV